MSKNSFQININTEILSKLRNKINEEQNISFNKKFEDKNNKTHRAWDKICAIMDRLDDTVDYLNQLELNTGKYRRSAFDFFDFMNNAAVVMDCISSLEEIFNVPDEENKTSTYIFNSAGKNGNGTDKKYFEYLRSLCSVHPIETSRHKNTYQQNDFECSPYVIWNSENLWTNNDSDLHVVVYTSKEEYSTRRVNICIDEIFTYINKRVNFIETIIVYIDKYQKEIIKSYINTPIKKEEDFTSYRDYLKNLEKEAKERRGDLSYYNFNYIIKLLELGLLNINNQDKMNSYINALKYATKFEHNSIQNMKYEGFENNGLLCPKEGLEVPLLEELVYPYSHSIEVNKYVYNLEKIQYLNSNNYCGDDIKWAYKQLKDMLPFLEKYVSFEGAKSNFENYALVMLALYLDCLENDCIINDNIPMNLR